MKVWVMYPDGRKRELEALAQGTPEQILEAVNEESSTTGLVLSEIRVDGVVLDAEAFLALSEGGPARETIFTLTSLRALLQESLDSAREYSGRLREGLETIAAQCEEGNPPLALISNALDGIGWLIAVYDRCRAFMAVPVRPEEEEAMKAGLLETMKTVVARLERGDPTGAAQALREGLMPRVQTLTLRVEDLAKARIAPQ